MAATTTPEDPPSMEFPGTTRYIVAQDALEYLKQNLSTFMKIFVDLHIPTSDYRLLAGFDEDILRGDQGFLSQIHVIILSEPADMAPFLSRLLPALGQFTAVVFTNKSTYHLPSALPEFTEIARVSTRKTARELPDCFSLSSNMDTGGVSVVGGPSGQDSNGKDDSKKGKEREDPDRLTSDPSKEGKGDGDPKFPGPGGGEGRDAQITFQVTTHLFQHSNRFQDLRVKGTLTTRRVPESQVPAQFASCELKFIEILTSIKKTTGELQYHQFQLVVEIDAKERHSLFSKVQPVTTPKYGPQSKVSDTAKKGWNSWASGLLNIAVIPQGTIRTSAGRSGELSTSTEHTLDISRIIQGDTGPVNSWTFHVTDPFEQERGLPLPSEKLPSMRIEFYGKSPVPPPPTHLDVAISTYWSVLCRPHGGNALLGLKFPKTRAPAFSNLCEIISLHLPSDLQGSHVYTPDLLVWPEQPVNRFLCTTSDEYQWDIDNLGATVFETAQKPSST